MPDRNIAWIVTPHGFGHATRACAIMDACRALDPAVRFTVFTRVPEFLFRESLPGGCDYRETLTDVGVVQDCPLREDLERTVAALDSFLPFAADRVSALAAAIRAAGCRLAVCDIAPLGIAAAAEAGVPSVLVENFTWDWIYAGYADPPPRLRAHAEYLGGWFGRATAHIQTAPVCRPAAAPDLTTPPVSRPFREPRAAVRARLGLGVGERVVLVSMGGVPDRAAALEPLRAQRGAVFVLPGAAARAERRGNLLLLPHPPGVYHPDLVRAVDAVVGKLGYSTVAEVYAAGVPYGYITRPHFREAAVLARFARATLPSLPIEERAFRSGAWAAAVPELLALSRAAGPRANGAGAAAGRVLALLDDC